MRFLDQDSRIVTLSCTRTLSDAFLGSRPSLEPLSVDDQRGTFARELVSFLFRIPHFIIEVYQVERRLEGS